MSRRKNPTNLLPAKAATSIKGDGRYLDGGGLYLQVRGNSRSWIFSYRWDGRRIEMGLGSAGDRQDEVSLAKARSLATEARQLLDVNKNPLEDRRAALAPKQVVPSFGDFTDDLLDRIEAGFRNEKHRYQWKQTLGDAYCASLRKKRLDQITTEHVLSVLQPIWTVKQETASRLRGRIEHVLDAAKAKGHRDGENPARWRGHLDKLLPKREKLYRGHLAAMPFAEVPAFVGTLREREAVTARALEFLILTAARSGEVRGAEWSELDLERAVWTVPAKRMKAGKEHRVPLTPRTIEILEEVAPLSGGRGLVFPSSKGGPLSDMAFKALFDRMEVKGVTAHGFRSAFRDWAGETTTFARELAEAALAHSVGNEVEQAYRRGDALEKRRKMMVAWERFLTRSPTGVLSFDANRKALG